MPQAEKPDSTTTSRRRFLAATAATAAAAASVAATAAAVPALAMSAAGGENPALVALGIDFERLFQIERDAWDAIPNDAPDSSWKPAVVAQEEVHKVIEQIALLPALTMDGLRLKARTVAWCHGVCYGPGDDKPVQYAQPSAALDTRIVHSIIQDLMKRWSPPPDADAAENNRSQHVSLMSADDQKATRFEHAIWDTRKPVRAGHLVVVFPANPAESHDRLQLGRVLRADCHEGGTLVVGLDGIPIDIASRCGIARVVSMMARDI